MWQLGLLGKTTGRLIAALVFIIGIGMANKVTNEYKQELAKVPLKGKASLYGGGERLNKKTAYGYDFDKDDPTQAAGWDYPRDTRLLIKSTKTGKSIRVRVTDIGPNRDLYPDRVVDLTPAGFRALGHDEKEGLADVEVTEEKRGEGKTGAELYRAYKERRKLKARKR